MVANRTEQYRARRELAKLRLKQQTESDGRQWHELVRQHPWISIGAAAGVGLALGLSPQLRKTALTVALDMLT